MKTIRATASWPPEISLWAIEAAAAAVSARFLGLSPESRAPTPSDFGQLKPSIACIHLGIAVSSPGFGRPPAPGGHQEKQDAEQELEHVHPGGRRPGGARRV